MKKISICLHCYNEEKNILPMVEAVINEMGKKPQFDYEIIFADNASTDNTQALLREISAANRKIKVIINNRNFGADKSGWNCFRRASGDAVISLACDFQEPIELISEFIDYWEKGEIVVLAQKVKSEESKIKYLLRAVYYKIIDAFSEVPQYEQITGDGLYDRAVINQLLPLGALVNYRHLVAELGYSVKLVPYVQQKRKHGKSSYNIAKYFDWAINSLVTTSTVPLRIATVLGCITSLLSFFIGVVYLIYKLIYWDSFSAGMAPMIISVFFLGSIQILFIGLIGEYIASIIKSLSKTPPVMEKELVNFDE